MRYMNNTTHIYYINFFVSDKIIRECVPVTITDTATIFLFCY